MIRKVMVLFVLCLLLIVSCSNKEEDINTSLYNEAIRVYAAVAKELLPTFREIKTNDFSRVNKNEKEIFDKYEKEIKKMNFKEKKEFVFLLLVSCRLSEESLKKLSALLGDDKEEIALQFYDGIKKEGVDEFLNNSNNINVGQLFSFIGK